MNHIKSYIKQSYYAIQLKSLLMLFSILTFAQFIFSDDLKEVQPADFAVGAQSGSDLHFFISGVNDPIGTGWLRLTRSAHQQK